MRIYLFAKRNTKEVLRDPVNLLFGLGFPLVLLVLLSAINAGIPKEANNPMFEIGNLAPGLVVFGITFMSLFSGMLLAKDRTSSFLTRLFISPMRSSEFLAGYSVPIIIMTIAQATITFAASCLFGLQVTIKFVPAILAAGIISILFIGLGLLCGSIMSDKAVGGICGALITNITGFMSGVFIPIDLIGGAFQTVCHALPFYHSVEAIKAILAGDFAEMLPHLGVVLAYGIVIYVIAIFAFKKKMYSGKI